MDKKEKQSYEKPVLRTIELVAEEVLGRGCNKPTSGTNTGHGGGCLVGSCSKVGTS